MAKKKTIRKELWELIQQKQSESTTEREKNHAVNLARAEINKKYGKDWREKENSQKGGYDFSRPSQYQDLGSEWDHYAWSADDY